MPRNVRVVTEYDADASGYIKGARAGKQSAAELQKALNASTKAADRKTQSVKKMGGELSSQLPVVGNFTNQLKSFAASPAGIVTGLTAAGAAVGAFVARQADAIDTLGKLTTSTNTGIEALSQYRHVAELSGIEFTKFTTALEKQSEQIGKGGKATEAALNKIGLSIEDIRDLKGDEQFEAIAEGLEGLDNEADKAAVALQLFGRNGREIRKITVNGAEGIRQMREEADRLGKTLGEDDAEAAAKFNDELARLGAAFDGVTQSIATGMLPAAADFLEFVNDALTEIPKLDQKVQELADSIFNLFGEDFKEDANEFVESIIQAGESMVAATGFTEVFNNWLEEIGFTAEETTEQLDDLSTKLGAVAGDEDGLTEASDRKTKSLKSQTAAVKDETEKLKELDRVAKLPVLAFRDLTTETEEMTDAMDRVARRGEEIDETMKRVSDGADETSLSLQDATQAAIDIGAAFAGAAIAGGSLNDSLAATLPLLGQFAGQQIGGLFPGGEQIGGSLGSFIGGALSQVFGGSDKRRKAFIQSTPNITGDFGPTGDTGFTGATDLGQILIAGSGGRRVSGDRELLEVIQKLDETIAETLNADELARAIQGGAASRRDDYDSLQFDQFVVSRAQSIFDEIGGEMGEAFDDLLEKAPRTAESVGDIVEALTHINGAIQSGELTDELPQTLTGAVDALQEYQQEGESLIETMARVVGGTNAIEASLADMGHVVTDISIGTSQALIDMSGGLDALLAQQQFFSQEFLSEVERAEIELEQAKQKTMEWAESLGLSSITITESRETFKEYVLSLDLTTEAGQRAYTAALEVADSFDVVYDAAEELEEGLKDIPDVIDDIIQSVTGVTGQSAAIGQQWARDVIENLLGSEFSDTLVGALEIDIDRIEQEREAALANASDYTLPASTRRAWREMAAILERAVASRRADLEEIQRLEELYPRLGEARFELEQQFSQLFDGSVLTDLEHAMGWEAFQQAWQQILDGAADAVVEPLDDFVDQVIDPISDIVDAVDDAIDDVVDAVGGGVDPVTGTPLDPDYEFFDGQDFGSAIADYVQGVLSGPQSSLTPEEQLNAAEQYFLDLVAQAQAQPGSVSAGQLTSAHSQYIQQLQSHLGVSTQYAEAFEAATAQLAQLGASFATGSDAEILQDQLAVLQNIALNMEGVHNQIVGEGWGGL